MSTIVALTDGSNGAAGEPKPLLRCRGLTKSFAAVRALRGVDFAVEAGRVRGLVGENGAGKSTLMKVVAGLYPPDGGSIEIEGVAVRFASTDQALARRIVTVHQDFNLIQSMTVAENLFLNNEPTSRLGTIRTREMRESAACLLTQYNVPARPADIVADLPNDIRKMVQIIKGVALRPKLLLLDEPTSSLTHAEVQVVLRLIRRLAGEGVGIVFISHYLAEVFESCDELTVLRDGSVVLDAPLRDTTLPEVVTAMIGRELQTKRRLSAATQRPLLRVADVTLPGSLRDISFTLFEGEILGVTGLAGSGLSELARVLFGASMPSMGKVEIAGRAVPKGSPARAMAAGMALLTGDRLREGILSDFSLLDNICLPILDRFANRAGALDRRAMVETTSRNLARLRVVASGATARARELSGGNQQKVLFAKWLETQPRVFVMDEPTIGIDVGSKSEIRAVIGDIAGAGVGILLATTELEDLVLLCDRVLIMFRGAIVGELVGGAISREAILRAATTGVPDARAA